MKKLMMAGLGVVILLLASVSCASSTHAPATTAVPAPTITMAVPAPAPGPFQWGSSGAPPATTAPVPTIAPPAPSSTPTGNGSDQSSLPTDRMVVRTGNIQMVVNDVSTAIDNITKIAANYGGYVVNSQKWKEGDRNIGDISIRVLAENYDKTVADLRTLAKSVTSESSSSQDVTEEYVDLQSRLNNLEAAETQLLKIMEGATKTEDVLAVQQQLTTVRGDIEQTKGRMQYLERTSATSIIEIRLEEAVLALKFSANKVSAGTDEAIQFNAEVIGGFAPYNYQWDFGDGKTSTDQSPAHSYQDPGLYTVSLKVTDDKGYTNTLARNEYINVIASWKPGSVANSAWNGFIAFGHVFVNILIWLCIFSPVWIVIGGIIWWRVYRKKKKA